MTFRGSSERDLQEFDRTDREFHEAVETQDDDVVETIMDERFDYRPEMFYSPDKLVLSYGVPAPTPAFVYNALGKKPLPTREEVEVLTISSQRIWHLFLDPHIRRELGGRSSGTSGSMKNLAKPKVMSMRVPLPPLPIQQTFAARVTEVRALETQQAASRRRLDDLFQSLLHRAFRGEL
jgi:hypothetical protein